MKKKSTFQHGQKDQNPLSFQKSIWVKPALTIIGKLREIVHGGLGSMGDGGGGGKKDNPHKP